MNIKNMIVQSVEQKQNTYLCASMKIWSHPELAFQETRSAEVLTEILSKEAFQIERPLAGIPTAFMATFGSGRPVIAVLGEYDALPGLSQEAGLPVQKPVIPGMPGHACGHNALGVGALAAAIAVKDFLNASGQTGTIRFYGCPAEESGGGKTFMVRAGCFSDVDACFAWHPAAGNLVQGFSSIANICLRFSFKGKASHAASSPYLGRSALDACELMNVGVNYLREHILPDARIHYAYLNAGGTAPNVVQEHAALKYYIRAPRISQALEIVSRVQDIARGAALMSGTTMESKVIGGMCDFQPNAVLGELTTRALEELGGPAFTEEDYALAERFFQQFSDNERSASLATLALSYPEVKRFRQTALISDVAPYYRAEKYVYYSSDIGDVSYAVPTVQLNMACYANGTPGHSWQLTAQSGSSLSHKGLLAAGKVLGLAMARLYRQPNLLAAARAEWLSETGGAYLCPIGDDIQPKLSDFEE